jgi:hypothetical protein
MWVLVEFSAYWRISDYQKLRFIDKNDLNDYITQRFKNQLNPQEKLYDTADNLATNEEIHRLIDIRRDARYDNSNGVYTFFTYNNYYAVYRRNSGNDDTVLIFVYFDESDNACRLIKTSSTSFVPRLIKFDYEGERREWIKQDLLPYIEMRSNLRPLCDISDISQCIDEKRDFHLKYMDDELTISHTNVTLINVFINIQYSDTVEQLGYILC